MPWGSDYISLDSLILRLIILTAFSTLSLLIISVLYPRPSLRWFGTLSRSRGDKHCYIVHQSVVDTRSVVE